MERNLILNVKGIQYSIEFPNVGKFQAIETMKQLVSKGMYSALLSNSTVSSSEALDMVDIESYFSILCPKLIVDIDTKCKSFSELDIADYIELRLIYQKDFIPWWNGILDMLKPVV